MAKGIYISLVIPQKHPGIPPTGQVSCHLYVLMQLALNDVDYIHGFGLTQMAAE